MLSGGEEDESEVVDDISRREGTHQDDVDDKVGTKSTLEEDANGREDDGEAG